MVMKNETVSQMFAQQKQDMLSLEKKLEKEAQDTFKAISSLRNHIVSIQLRIDISLAATSRSLGALQTLTENIALKMESLENMVKSLTEIMGKQGMNQPSTLCSTCQMVEEAWKNLPVCTPELGTIPDITCKETIGPFNDQGIGPIYQYGGFMDFLDLESPEEPMS